MTVIYNMSIDRADKPWIGDRRLTESQIRKTFPRCHYSTGQKTLGVISLASKKACVCGQVGVEFSSFCHLFGATRG